MNFLTVKEVAKAIKASEHTVRLWCREGTLPALKVNNGPWLIFADYQDRLADNLTRKKS